MHALHLLGCCGPLNARVPLFRHISEVLKGTLADPRGGTRDVCPPGGPNSFNFMQFLAKI